jgi:hypothetical protein
VIQARPGGSAMASDPDLLERFPFRHVDAARLRVARFFLGRSARPPP